MTNRDIRLRNIAVQGRIAAKSADNQGKTDFQCYHRKTQTLLKLTQIGSSQSAIT